MKVGGAQQGALHGARRQEAAARADPRPAGADLHRRIILPRQQRRTEGHGPDHAHPDRRCANRLRAQSRDAREHHAGVPADDAGRAKRCSRRMPGALHRPATAAAARATVGEALKTKDGEQARGLRRARRADRRYRPAGEGLRRDQSRAGRRHAERAQRHVPGIGCGARDGREPGGLRQRGYGEAEVAADRRWTAAPGSSRPG